MSRRTSVYEKAVPYVIRALTPLHPGSGARISGVVDLPIQREAHSGLPVIYGSSLKGSLRSAAPHKLRGVNQIQDVIREIFGSKPGERPLEMGEAIFTDAKLLFFPVKSLRGVYAWITSPFILSRFSRDMEILSELAGSDWRVSVPDSEVRDPEVAIVPNSETEITVDTDSGEVVVLEDVGLMVKRGQIDLGFLDLFDSNLGEEVSRRIAIVHHDVFKHLLSRGMEIAPHIRIDPEKGTVQERGLWYQENLPPETLLYASVFTTRGLCEHMKKILSGYVQLGGDATTGLGIIELLGAGVDCDGRQQED